MRVLMQPVPSYGRIPVFEGAYSNAIARAGILKRNNEVTRKRLFIEELERPIPAAGAITTLAVGEESIGGGDDKLTTMMVGEEAIKA